MLGVLGETNLSNAERGFDTFVMHTSKGRFATKTDENGGFRFKRLPLGSFGLAHHYQGRWVVHLVPFTDKKPLQSGRETVLNVELPGK